MHTLMLGENYPEWGAVSVERSPDGRTVHALSVGADPASPSMRSKGNLQVPNEDALLSIEEGDRTLLAVADAHHGHESATILLSALSQLTRHVPRDFAELAAVVDSLRTESEPGRSACTFLVAILDRKNGAGCGLSFGDSSLVQVGQSGAHVVNVRDSQYLQLSPGYRIHSTDARAFQFFARPGELLLAHTDGINECHYRSPETSVSPRHLAKLFAEVGDDPQAYATELMHMALDGVNGHPGGQDNIALVVTRIGGART